jgi:hypothetical protein
LGAAQKDTARELGAKLSSLKGIVWVGVGLFVFGLASLVYPPLKVIIGSVTTSAALMLGGVALMVLPSLIVGNELLILGGVAVAVGGWFLAHRHGQLRGIVAASTGTPPAGTGPSQSRITITHHASRITHHVSRFTFHEHKPPFPHPLRLAPSRARAGRRSRRSRLGVPPRQEARQPQASQARAGQPGGLLR